MRLGHVLFLLTLAACALLGAAFLLPAAANSRGILHPDFHSMLRGGSGAARHGATMLWIGWAVGTVQILLFVALMALGARRRGGLHGLGRPLMLATAAYVGVWTWLVLSYRGFAHDPDPQLILALPAPTAIMLYVLWPLPLVFVGFYVVGFRRWVLSEEDEAAFAQLVSRRRARSGESA